jgi:predicted nucleic acid-binding protein
MAAAAVIADSSALVALAQLGHLALLESLFGQILVPPAVAR